MSLIRNERTKLLANALDRISTACVAVGIFAPFGAAMTDFGAAPTWTGLFSASIWISAAIALHMGARSVLGGLE